MERLLEVRELRTYFETAAGTVRAVDGVDLTLDAGDTLGIVGESGCGKTVLALSILRLVPQPPGRIVSGKIIFNGCDLLGLGSEEMRKIRGRDISMIFQEPMTSLNPVFRTGEQVAEAVRTHQGLGRKEALKQAVEMFRLVGFPDPERRVSDYPHQMSGGMRQRVMIAMALSCNPRLMLADEPTTALDVTIQAQILDLIERLKERIGTAVIMITHDLGVIAETAKMVAVMYAGYIVEYGAVLDVFTNPLHPYTVGLMESVPKIDDGGSVKAIPGAVPSLFQLPLGCRFHERCRERKEFCERYEPVLQEWRPGHFVRCGRYIEGGAGAA